MGGAVDTMEAPAFLGDYMSPFLVSVLYPLHTCYVFSTLIGELWEWGLMLEDGSGHLAK